MKTSVKQPGMFLAWRIARREMRSGLKGFRVFLLCLVLGVAAIAAVGTLREAVTDGLRVNARSLLGGDVSVRQLQRPLSKQQRAYIKANTKTISTTIEMIAMAQTKRARALVELKAVDSLYPLVGQVKLEPAIPLRAALAQRNGAWGAAVERSLLIKLNLALGARVRVGNGVFVIRAVLTREPDRMASLLNFGPRIMISSAALADTALVRAGSQIRYFDRMLLSSSKDANVFIKKLKARFPQAGWRISGPDNAAPGLKRFIDHMGVFLTFAGLTTLLVGGIGVLGAVRSYLDTKSTTIATFKGLGAPGGLVFQIYLLQILVLSLFGIGIGLLIGAILPEIGIELFKDFLPVMPQLGIYPLALAKAGTFGFLVAMTFALWPVAQARETPAANLFRTHATPVTTWPRLRYVFIILSGMILLAVLVIVWTKDHRFALGFVLVSIAGFLFLRLSAFAVMWAAKRMRRPQSVLWRLAFSNLYRPGSATPAIMLALGAGLSVLVAVALIQGNIARLIQSSIPDQAPTFFFIDIQPTQAALFDQTLKDIPGAGKVLRMPSLRGRIVKIGGVPVAQANIAADVRWAVNGDRVLSYAARPAPGTRIASGAWWPENYSGPALISLDANIARGFGIGVGDTLSINVLGRVITAKIASLRTINWHTLRFDSAIIFSPGTLESAPQTFIAAIKAQPSAENEIERRITQKFPNISTIRVRDALEAVYRLIRGISAAVTGTALLTVLAGMIVLAGTIAAARAKSIYDSVIFKVLGATRRQIIGAFLLEYSLIGLVSGTIGAAFGTFIAWAVVRFMMGVAWTFLPVSILLSVGGIVAFSALAGLFGVWQALGEKATRHLRNE